MIVNHQYRFIFIKTRKTAGTSLEIALSEYADGQAIVTAISDEDEAYRQELGFVGPQNDALPLRRLHPKDYAVWLYTQRKPRFYNHMPATQVRSYLSEDIWNSYYKFCFERNPWDKAVSQYYWTQHKHQMDFDTFIESGTANQMSSFDIYSEHQQPIVDQVYRFEALDAALLDIAERVGLPKPLRMPKKRAKSKTGRTKKPYQSYFNEHTRAVIAKAFAREIAYFDYAFDRASSLDQKCA